MNRKLSNKQVSRIRDLYTDKGWSLTKIAKKYDVQPSCIFAVVNNKSYHDPKYKPPKQREFNVNFAADLKGLGRSLKSLAKLEADDSGHKQYSVSQVSKLLRKHKDKRWFV